MKLIKSHAIYKILEIILIIFWLMAMRGSSSLYIPYLIVGILGILACYTRTSFGVHVKSSIITTIFALIFTFFVCSANYNLFPTLSLSANIISSIIELISIVIGSFIVFYNVLIMTPTAIDSFNTHIDKSINQKIFKLKPSQVFWLSFLIIAVVYLIVFFVCKFPGNLSYDSTMKIDQAITGEYTGRHPFMHTLLISLFVNLGRNIFGDLNAGVAFYVVFQILLFASIFAFSISTLYRAKHNPKLIIALLVIYALLPYHIMYSMTIWTDCLFAVMLLLFITVGYRLFNKIGPSVPNYILLFISSLITCLSKGNGLYVIVFFLLLFVIFYWRQIFKTREYLPSCIITLCTIILAFAHNSFLLPALNISKPELMESLSIPAQQIARVIVDDPSSLTDEQKELLSHVSSLDEIADDYTPWLSDPIKWQVWRSEGGEDYLREHKFDYIKLYLELGLRHPLQYLEAWSDQTKGYFNGGYNYWVVENGIVDNRLDIKRRSQGNIPDKIFDTYLAIFEKNPTMRIIYCIGFYSWIAICLLYITIIRKDLKSILLASLPVALVVTLLIAAPVYSEFRYIYPVCCCLPFLSVIIVNNQAKQPKPRKK